MSLAGEKMTRTMRTLIRGRLGPRVAISWVLVLANLGLVSASARKDSGYSYQWSGSPSSSLVGLVGNAERSVALALFAVLGAGFASRAS